MATCPGAHQGSVCRRRLRRPFGLVTERQPLAGRCPALKFDIKTYNINPSVAYRINDKVSVGGGLSYQRMEVEYVRLATVASAALAATRADPVAGDNSWGWNVGACSPSARAPRWGCPTAPRSSTN
jgi:long-chain fatty acid transport protein